MTGPEAIDRTRMGDRAYETIREALLNGEFAAGERLDERQLAARIGASRVPVRDALRRLGDDGLVDEVPHRGRFVRAFAAGDIADIYNVRLALEPLAIRIVTREHKPIDLLEAIVDRMREAVAVDDVGALNRLELEFHKGICELSENRMLIDCFDAIAAQVRLALSLDNQAYPDRSEIPDEHVPLLDAMRSGDESRAAEEIVDHIGSTIDRLLEQMPREKGASARPRLIQRRP